MDETLPRYPFHDGHVQERIRRADGECVCDSCARPYRKHPLEPSILSGSDDAPFLHRLCDGSLVKL